MQQTPRFQPVEPIESGALSLAFDHAQIVRDALETDPVGDENTLRSRLGSALWSFTIRQLRQVYETVWGIPLDPGNFQRFVRESGAFEQRRSAAPPPELSASTPSHDTDPQLGFALSAPVVRGQVASPRPARIAVGSQKGRTTAGRPWRPGQLPVPGVHRVASTRQGIEAFGTDTLVLSVSWPKARVRC